MGTIKTISKIILLILFLQFIFQCSLIRFKKPVKDLIDYEEAMIIPKPNKVEYLPGNFKINEAPIIIRYEENSDLKTEADYLIEKLSRIITRDKIIINPSSSDYKQSKSIIFKLSNSRELSSPEGYKLDISEDQILVQANNPEGIFYGIQSIMQLLPPEVYSRQKRILSGPIKLPCLKITDEPRFKYRGMHLDVCRHFFPVSFVKRYIDYLAYHKLNTFHFHLTEDQGWRIEIKKYPKLTQVGSIRKETVIGKTNKYDGKPYGGYYTQDEIREIVEYAQKQHITVIPEIEMPGHSIAALAAYPQYSCTGGPFEVRTRWGISKDIYCAGNDSTFIFLENILKEVMQLFPSRYIHIGGDEAPKERWEECPKCQQRIEEEDLANEDELQSYFIRRIEKFLNEHGRQIIGWDEILEGGLAPGATVMSWRGMQGGIKTARQGHDAIMVPSSHLYFDGYQGDPEIEPLAIGYWAPLEKVYNFDPVPNQLNAQEKKHIIGVQANLWTEYISTEGYAEYMLMPRISALSEIGWSQEAQRSWYDFSHRIQKQYQRYMAMEANFRIPVPDIDKLIVLEEPGKIELEAPITIGTIHYTTDNTRPKLSSSVYNEPINIDQNTLLKSAVFLPNGRSSSIVKTTILLKNNAPEDMDFGLKYNYFEDNFESFIEIENKAPDFTGSTYALDISKLKRRADNFTIQFTGYLDIKNPGRYTFYLTSDDGSQLILDEEIVTETPTYITNPVNGSIYLEKGRHKLVINYEDIGGAENLELEYSAPGMTRREIAPWNFLQDKN
jgi:hexosaminidase